VFIGSLQGRGGVGCGPHRQTARAAAESSSRRVLKNAWRPSAPGDVLFAHVDDEELFLAGC
jgi:hypothetical protein